MNLLPNETPKNSKFESNLNIIFNSNNEYVPLFSINKMDIVTNVRFSKDLANSTFLKDLNLNYETFTNNIPYQNYINRFNSGQVDFTNKNNVKLYLKAIKETLNDYINDNVFKISKSFISTPINSYELLFNNVSKNNYWQLCNLRLNDYLLNYGYIGLYNKNEDGFINFKTVLCFVVKPENIKHLRLCHLTNKPLNPELIELWMEEGFEDKNSEHKLLKMNYKKFLKPFVTDNKIKVTEIKNMDDKLFTKIVLPALKTIKGRTEWLNQFNKEFIEHESFIHKLNTNSNIKLIYE